MQSCKYSSSLSVVRPDPSQCPWTQATHPNPRIDPSHQWWANLKSNLLLKCQIFQRNGFKSLGQILNFLFSSSPNSFKVKSQIKYQIFHKTCKYIPIKCHIKLAIFDALYFRPNHTWYTSYRVTVHNFIVQFQSASSQDAVSALNRTRS